MQRRKICNAYAPGTKSTNSSVDVCNAYASPKNQQCRCVADAGNLQGTCRELAGNLQGTCRQVQKRSHIQYGNLSASEKILRSSPDTVLPSERTALNITSLLFFPLSHAGPQQHHMTQKKDHRKQDERLLIGSGRCHHLCKRSQPNDGRGE